MKIIIDKHVFTLEEARLVWTELNAIFEEKKKTESIDFNMSPYVKVSPALSASFKRSDV